jgi:hypothetical protein
MYLPVSIHMLTQLAQATPNAAGSTDRIVLMVVILISLLLLGAIGILLLRRRLFQAESGGEATTGLMDAMRKMRDSGEMSAAEYEATVRSMSRKASEQMLGRATPKPRAGPKASGGAPRAR